MVEDIEEEKDEFTKEDLTGFKWPAGKRLPMWLQLTICGSIFVLICFGCISMIGKGEYNRAYCEDKLEEAGKNLISTDKTTIFEDQKNKFLRGLDGSMIWGCCRIPEGMESVSKREHCIYTPNYEIPSFPERWDTFLKKFK